MKLNKKVLSILEQYYNTDINNPRVQNQDKNKQEDVPFVNDDEYKTFLSMEGMDEPDDVKEPIIKTKKGKNILREPPDEDIDANDITDIRVIDKNGKTLKQYDDLDEEFELDSLDYSEEEEKVNRPEDEDLLVEATDTKKPKPVKDVKVKDEDPNNMEGTAKIAQDNMGEQNPGLGKDPNIDPSQTQPNPSSMMGAQTPLSADPYAMGGGGGAYQDPYAMGAGGGLPTGVEDIDPMTGQPKMTLEVVGKVYELKKIYSRLLAVQSQLSFSSDVNLLQLRKFITKAIDLFETVISNIGVYKKEIDDIIIMYYKFLEEIYALMKKFYKDKEREEKEQNKE